MEVLWALVVEVLWGGGQVEVHIYDLLTLTITFSCMGIDSYCH